MEEKCLNCVNLIALNLTNSSTVASTSTASENLLEDSSNILPSTSRRRSMSLVQEDFDNSQHDFAEVLDDETTTSGVLETFEISSSNSLPTCSDNALAVDDSSSTDTIKLVDVTQPTPCNNSFFNSSEVYVINDDDDDDDIIVEGEVAATTDTKVAKTSHITVGSGHTDNRQINGLIMTTGGASIYLETPVVEEQQQHHSQILSLAGQLDYSDKSGKPKRLSDKFLLGENSEQIVEIDDETSSSNIQINPLAPSDANENNNFQSIESQDKSDLYAERNSEAQHDKMSFRLKKMNINNSTTHQEANVNAPLNTMPSSSHVLMAPTMADIESMDLIERRDFETEQRLTGGIIFKSSSFANNNMLNLGLINACVQSQNHQLKSDDGQQEMNDDCPSSSTNSSRAVSSDSKCTYKDLMSTPTSSRNYNSRLTKSTAKLNLCSTLSYSQQQQHHHTNKLQRTAAVGVNTKTQGKIQLQKHIGLSNTNSSSSSSSSSSSTSSSSSPSTSSSVIVEAPLSTGSSSTCNTAARTAGIDVYSNSNSNDSLMGGSSTTRTTTTTHVTAKIDCQQEQEQQQKQHLEQQHQQLKNNKHLTHTIETESGCSRTSVMPSLIAMDNIAGGYDEDAQPSTSSARCQYAPPSKNFRQMHHASAQTIEKYLSRGNSGSSSSTGIAATVSSSASSNVGIGGVNLSIAGKNRRRTDPTAHLTRNSTSEEVIAAFKVVVAEAAAAAAAAERGEFNEETWVDCEENNSDLEEICTCHHNISDSSHGGSNASLNETDDLEVLGCYYRDGADLSNYIQMVSISEEAVATSSDCVASSSQNNLQQRKRKYNDGRLLDSDYNNLTINNGGCPNSSDMNSRKRVAYDHTSTPRSSQNSLALVSTPSSQIAVLSATGSPIGRRTPRSLIPTRDNPPPELQNWLMQFQRWSHAERLLAIDRLIEKCEPTQVRHMMKVIEPQFQRDFISLLPRELALQVLSYLEPKDLLRAAQTCHSWRYLCDDNLLWKEKCRKAQILTEPRTDRPKRGRAGNMPPIASPWKAAYMRQHIIEMNWRSRPIREPKVLKGHDDHVITCLQFSGNRIVSGSDDNTLKVWSAVTGRCLRTLIGHTGGVWSSQMSGNIIISGSTDRTLKVWDMENGQCVHTLLGHTSTVRCMHLHGNKVVSGSRDATLRVWDIEQGTCLHVLVGHLAAVRCVQYDGKLIVSGAYDYMVKIWHPERQECLHTLQGHTNRVYSLQFDGYHVVSGSLDTSIRVWDVETGNCKHTLMGHQSLTSGMELRQNILVSGNADSTVKVWDITTGQCLQTLSGPNKHQSAVTCLQFNSRFVVTSSDDGTVKLWDVKTGEFIRNLVALESGGSGGVVWRIRANDTKLICAVGSRNGTEETKLMVLDFDVEGACVKCS